MRFHVVGHSKEEANGTDHSGTSAVAFFLLVHHVSQRTSREQRLAFRFAVARGPVLWLSSLTKERLPLRGSKLKHSFFTLEFGGAVP